MFGLLRSALMFYHKLRKELEDYGFVVNPYDPCVANKIIKTGHQQMVVWHVDDLVMLHVDAFENTKLISYLREIYGPKMTATRGKKHRYLGMDMDYSKAGTLSVTMISCIDSIIKDFPELIERAVRTLHTDNLFKVRDANDAEFLCKELARAFHFYF